MNILWSLDQNYPFFLLTFLIVKITTFKIHSFIDLFIHLTSIYFFNSILSYYNSNTYSLQVNSLKYKKKGHENLLLSIPKANDLNISGAFSFKKISQMWLGLKGPKFCHPVSSRETVLTGVLCPSSTPSCKSPILTSEI